MSATLSMRQAATAVGKSWERFRKDWPRMVREEGLPAPFTGRTWDAAALAAWKAQRTGRALAVPAADPGPATPGPQRLRAQRAELHSIRAD